VAAVTAMMMMVPLHRRLLFLLPTDRKHRCLLLPFLSCRVGGCTVLAGYSGEERSSNHHSLGIICIAHASMIMAVPSIGWFAKFSVVSGEAVTLDCSEGRSPKTF
jgi:hypothetical protein